MYLRLGAMLFAASCIVVSVAAVPSAARSQKSLIDPAGDANYLNTQRLVVSRGDVAGPVDASAAADILALWFTHDRNSVTAHIQTEAPPTESDPAYMFRVHIDPGTGTNCLWFETVTPGRSNPNGVTARFHDTCSQGQTWLESDGVRASFRKSTAGTGIATVTVPRGMHPLFEHGGDLITPYVTVRHFHFDQVYAPQIDDTRLGKTYRLPPP